MVDVHFLRGDVDSTDLNVIEAALQRMRQPFRYGNGVVIIEFPKFHTEIDYLEYQATILNGKSKRVLAKSGDR